CGALRFVGQLARCAESSLLDVPLTELEEDRKELLAFTDCTTEIASAFVDALAIRRPEAPRTGNERTQRHLQPELPAVPLSGLRRLGEKRERRLEIIFRSDIRRSLDRLLGCTLEVL